MQGIPLEFIHEVDTGSTSRKTIISYCFDGDVPSGTVPTFTCPDGSVLVPKFNVGSKVGDGITVDTAIEAMARTIARAIKEGF